MTDEAATGGTQRTYPQGVPSWVDTEHPDPDAAAEFYGGLFGWVFEERMPPHLAGSYRIATIDGRDVGAIASATGDGPARWNTYVAVDDADVTADAVRAAGGTADDPQTAGPGGSAGRSVACIDPGGVRFSLWQAGERLGAQYVNAPGGWVFSDLRAAAPDDAIRFYAELFDWRVVRFGGEPGSMLQRPGYGDHLAATSDPDIRERQVGAPDGFADVVASLRERPAYTPEDAWVVQFSVADRDDSAKRVEELGGTVLATYEGYWLRAVEALDPQGAAFSMSQFAPQG